MTQLISKINLKKKIEIFIILLNYRKAVLNYSTMSHVKRQLGEAREIE